LDDPADHPEAPILDRLRSLGIDYLRIDHPAVFTAEEARAKVPPMPGAKAKNLLVQDRSGEQVFMVTVPYDKSVDLKALAAALGTRKLSFVSAESMQELIGVTPGAVSLLGLINDKGCKVRPVIDRVTWQSEALQCHPLVNTATLSIGMADVARLFEATGHAPMVIDVPSRAPLD
jgi:Ala-tRNA(Pro) deacylase